MDTMLYLMRQNNVYIIFIKVCCQSSKYDYFEVIKSIEVFDHVNNNKCYNELLGLQFKKSEIYFLLHMEHCTSMRRNFSRTIIK